MSNSALYDVFVSPTGRLSRRSYWIANLSISALNFAAVLVDFLLKTHDPETGFGPFQAVATLILFWPSIAILVKRAHDRGRGWWFILLLIVPLINLWPAISLVFFRGTEGENDFGPDPYEEKPVAIIWICGVVLAAIYIAIGYQLASAIPENQDPPSATYSPAKNTI